MEQSKVLILLRNVNSLTQQYRLKIALALLICALNVGVQAKTYRWIDASGETVYSQVPPPPDVETTEIAPPPKPSTSPMQSRERLNQQLQKLEDNREDQEIEADKADKEQQAAQQQAERCRKARHNLTQLQRARGNSRYKDSQGQYHRLTAETLEEKKAEARSAIEESCSE